MDVTGLPFAERLRGTVDSHIHCGPHINRRTVTAFDAVRQAAAAGQIGVGFMDVFANTSGLAALAMRELGELGVEAFGGIILEPYVGGIDPRVVGLALGMGYGENTGARFVSLPCHHTQFVARSERRSEDYVARCYALPERAEVCDAVKEIIDLVAAADAVFNTGHVSGSECLRLVAEARRRGCEKVLSPAAYFTRDEAVAIADEGAFLEFSFFVLSHATSVGQTMIDSEKHRFPSVTIESVAEKIRAVGPERVVLSTDSGSYVLPPPVEAFREFLIMIQGAGFDEAELYLMAATNPASLFLRRGSA